MLLSTKHCASAHLCPAFRVLHHQMGRASMMYSSQERLSCRCRLTRNNWIARTSGRNQRNSSQSDGSQVDLARDLTSTRQRSCRSPLVLKLLFTHRYPILTSEFRDCRSVWMPRPHARNARAAYCHRPARSLLRTLIPKGFRCQGLPFAHSEYQDDTVPIIPTCGSEEEVYGLDLSASHGSLLHVFH